MGTGRETTGSRRSRRTVSATCTCSGPHGGRPGLPAMRQSPHGAQDPLGWQATWAPPRGLGPIEASPGRPTDRRGPGRRADHLRLVRAGTRTDLIGGGTSGLTSDHPPHPGPDRGGVARRPRGRDLAVRRASGRERNDERTEARGPDAASVELEEQLGTAERRQEVMGKARAAGTGGVTAALACDPAPGSEYPLNRKADDWERHRHRPPRAVRLRPAQPLRRKGPPARTAEPRGRIGSHLGAGRELGVPRCGRDGGRDIRVWFMDQRTGRWNVWYRASSDLGRSWSTAVRISDATSGTPARTPRGSSRPTATSGR